MKGQVIESYQVLEKLGEGGMGEVYRARDLKLRRDVALKVLPDTVARDPDRRARFEREAYVLAALNHPRIASIHGVAESEGVTALVLELVEGPTLQERLAGGALPLDETLAIARQIAEALDAAHEAGIVHRDLKPSNIKLRPDGSVKVLDFGLAKAIGDHPEMAADRSHVPTVADATSVGVILGTAAYMAPEQARGQAVDKRADIWAFGVVLWEMLTGRPLFDGGTLTDTLAAVLTRDIDWTRLPASTPPALVDLLRRCLERDPKKRLRDIGDARLDAHALAATSAAGAAPAAAQRWWPWGLAIAAALGVGLAVGVNVRGAETTTAPPATEVRFTFSADDPSSAAISPDGSMAVVASGSGPLRVRDLSGSLRVLSGTDGAIKPFWSPDSQTIGYGRAGRLWRVSAAGGAPAVICDLPGGAWDEDAGGAWLPDDTIVFSTGGSPLMRVPAAGGDPVQHLAADAPGDLHFHNPHALPAARGLVYVVHRDAGSDTLEVFADGTRKVLLQAPGQDIQNPVYSPTGHILFARTPINEGIWALPFSLERLEATGTAYLVQADIGVPSISATGTFLNVPAASTLPTRLHWWTRDGTREAIGEASQFDPFPALSPDGTQVAIGERVSGTWGLSVIDLARGTRVRLARGERVTAPAWTRDGRSLLYGARLPDEVEPVIRLARLDGSPPETLASGQFAAVLDGSRYLFDRFANNDYDLLIGTLDRTAPPVTFVGGELADAAPSLSPDRRFVAHLSMPSITVGNPEIVLRRYPSTAERWQITSGGGFWPRWTATGDRVYYMTPDGIYEVDVTTSGEAVTLSRPRRVIARRALPTEFGPDGFDVARDGRFLLLEQASASTERPVHVVLNWTPRRAPGT